ncbi:MAG TPA: efflux transporter outer membrane subunit [Candidatus Sulfotelmatobacter sp.]|nr:efflux transporter outer membrane subunit [Candidatus Sulfotelmatobacter sp.]
MKKLVSPMSGILFGVCFATFASLQMTGCMVGPNYHRPVVQTPGVYRDLNENSQVQVQAASFADLPWWQVFQDPQLQELIRTALKENYDLQLATERIAAARAQVTITRSSLFPQVQAGGNFAGGKDPTTQAKYNILALTADAAFQLDLFGRLRRATEASRAELLATEDARNTVILTLVSDVASDYFTLLQLDLELQITRDTVNTQEDSVKLTRLRLDHGVATKLDVLQAEQVLDTANAQIPDLERQIGQEEDAISTLLGHYPDSVRRGRRLTEQPLPPDVPPGMPSTLLERRPDIRQVEQVLIAANAEIGVAKAAFFPQISLTGSGGGAFGRSTLLSGLMSSQTGIWSYGAQVTQPIFTGGALRGDLRLAESQHRQELIAYKQVIQLAFRDVSDALIGYQKLHQVRVAQETTVKDLQDTVDTSLVRYRGGITTYLEVLDGQRSLFEAELTLAQARGNEYQSLVQLYKALGGGWQQDSQMPNGPSLHSQNLTPN